MIDQISSKPNELKSIDVSSGDITYVPTILIPFDLFLRESEIWERPDVLRFISMNKDYRTVRWIVPKYYSIYLLCHLIFDILDILSNELFFVQTKIDFCFEEQFKMYFIHEFKNYIKMNIPFIQKNKVLPIYVKFIQEPSFHIEYTICFDQRFHVLFLKESENGLSIQRIHFGIDL